MKTKLLFLLLVFFTLSKSFAIVNTFTLFQNLTTTEISPNRVRCNFEIQGIQAGGSYALYYSLTPDFQNQIVGGTGFYPISNFGSWTVRFHYLEGLLPNTQYYWRVEAISSQVTNV